MMVYEFDGIRFDSARNLLVDAERSVALAPRTGDLLRLFLDHPGRVLSREEILARLWSDTAVSDTALWFQLSKLRQALGDAGKQWLETVPRRGWLWNPVATRAPASPAGQPVERDSGGRDPGVLPGPPGEGTATPLIGRARELETLRRRLAAARQGPAQVLLVGGDTGVGKSRLIDELLRDALALGFAAGEGRVLESGLGLPLYAFYEVLRAVLLRAPTNRTMLAGLADLAGELVALFPGLDEIAELRLAAQRPPRPRSEPRDRNAAYETLARGLSRIAETRPLLVVLDELHASEDTIEAVRYLARRLVSTPLLLVATYRGEEVSRAHPLRRLVDDFRGDRRFTHLVLETLDAAAHHDLVDLLAAGAAVEPATERRLFALSGGNPLLARELFLTLAAEDVVGRGDDLDAPLENLPASVEQAVERRLRRLPEELRERLAELSVLGRRFGIDEPELLAPAAPVDDRAVDALLAAGFLVAEGRPPRGLRFAWPVIADLLYAGLSRRRRRDLHRAVAESLEELGPARRGDANLGSRLAHHFAAAEVPAKAFAHSLELARSALAQGAGEEAERAARLALENIDERGGPAEVVAAAEAHRLLGRACFLVGRFDGALAQLRIATSLAERAGDAAGALEALVLAGELSWEARLVDDAAQLLGRALTKVRRGAPPALARRALRLAALLAELRGDRDRASSLWAELDALGRDGQEAAVRAGEWAEQAGGRLVIGSTGAVDATHPGAITRSEEVEVLGNVFETLVASDDDGRLVPGLAASWLDLDGGRTFDFHLREGASWHDGSPVDAATVALALRRAWPATGSRPPAAFLALSPTGSEPSVDSIVALDPKTLRLRLPAPVPRLPALLSDPRSAIALPHGDELLGSGPFRLARRQPTELLLLAHRPAGTTAGLDEVVVRCGLESGELARALRAGQLDVAAGIRPADLEELLALRSPALGLVEGPLGSTAFVCISTRGRLADDAAARRALLAALPIHELLPPRLGRLAVPAISLFPPGSPAHDPGRRLPVLAATRALPGDWSGTLRVAVHPVFLDRYVDLTERLLALWRATFPAVEVVNDDYAGLVAAIDARLPCDLILMRWVADYADPEAFAAELFDRERGRLRHHLERADLADLVAAAAAEPEAGRRLAAFRRFELELLASEHFAPLFHEVGSRVVGPRVRGLALSATGPFVQYSALRKLAPGAVTGAARQAVLEVPVPWRLDELDPALIFTVAQGEQAPLVFETLTRTSDGARVIPWLAEEWRQEAGGQRYRFRLRRNLRFHDGRLVTARDVRASFERLLSSSESRSRWLLAPIVGAVDLLEGRAGELAGFEVLAADTFVVHLVEPLPFFPALVAYAPTSVVPEGTRSFAGSWRQGTVGTGPFRVARLGTGRLALEANPHYWRPDQPRLSRIDVVFEVASGAATEGFRDGRYGVVRHLAPSDVRALERDPRFAGCLHRRPALATYYAAFNCHRGPLADPAVREALVAALPLAELVAAHLTGAGVRAHQLIPPGLLTAPPRPASPRSLPHRLEGLELSVLVNAAFQGAFSGFARHLLAALEAAGVRLQVLDLEEASYYETIRRGGVDLLITRWLADYPDADNFAYGLLHSREGIVGRFCGLPTIDQLVEEGRRLCDWEARQDVYRQLEELLADDYRLLPLFHEQLYCFIHPDLEGGGLDDFVSFVRYPDLAWREEPE